MGLSKVQSNISQHGNTVESWAHLIDIVLNNSSPDHGSGTGEEASSDPLDRSEVYADPTEARVKEEIEDRYEN